MRRAVLVISASMGAGHDGAARELQRRLEQRGLDVGVVDYLGLIPLGLGRLVRWSYRFQLRVLPWTYEMTYRALGVAAPLLWGPVVRLMSLVTRRGLRRELLATRPDAVVSTYPLAALVLGRMRKRGWLRVPVATYITDFAVHPLWVHPGVDVHLAVSSVSAQTAARRSGGASEGCGPLVADRFTVHDRQRLRRQMRHRLAIGDGERAVLVVAGSWGVGDVPATLDAIERAGGYHPITVCGRDDRLVASLVAHGTGGTVLGWTDEMPALMAAADALVENAGGLTAMEAFAAGLPVVTFHPIAGHGKENARTMAAAGVSWYAHDDSELAAALGEATTPGPARDARTAAGEALFAGDAAAHVEDLAATTGADALLIPWESPKRGRRIGLVAASLAALYLALTLGAQTVAALGVGVAKPPSGATREVFLGVRVDAADLSNPSVRSSLRRWQLTLVVDAQTARHRRLLLERLAAARVDIANGGWGHTHMLRWQRAHDDCPRSSSVIANAVGVAPREFVPARRLDAFDQIYCRTGRRHERLVEATTTFEPGRLPRPRGRTIVVLDGRSASPAALVATLRAFAASAERSGLILRSFRDLH